MKANDRAWLATLRACRLFPEDTAVEWSQENVGGLAVVALRITTPEGGRLTVYAPDNTTAGISMWMGFYDVETIRARRAAEAR